MTDFVSGLGFTIAVIGGYVGLVVGIAWLIGGGVLLGS